MDCLELVSNGGDVGELSLKTVGMKEGTRPGFGRGGRSDLEGKAAEDTRRAGGYSGRELTLVRRRRSCSGGLWEKKLGYDGVYLGGQLSEL